MSADTHIGSAELVLQRFGFWPPFEDAEVLALRFDRGNHMSVVARGAWNERTAQSLEATFFVFDARYARTATERKPSSVVIRFEPLSDFTMSGFNYQNPIMGLEISRTAKGGFRVRWGGTAMHHEVSFSCQSIRVLSVASVVA